MTEWKEPASYTSSEAHKAGLFVNEQKQPKATTTARPSQLSGRESSTLQLVTASNEYRHEVGAAGASPLTSRPSSSSRREQRRLGFVACN